MAQTVCWLAYLLDICSLPGPLQKGVSDFSVAAAV